MSHIKVTAKLLLILSLVGAPATAQQSRLSASPADLKRQAAALESGGLRAAAAVNGFYVSTERLRAEAGIDSLEDLVRRSELVISARVLGNTGKPTIDGRSAYSEYFLQPQSAIRGRASVQALVAIVPGGRVDFDTGVAQINVAGIRRPVNGELNIWFLRRASPQFGANAWELVGGALGLFRIIDGFVRPAGGFEATFSRALFRSPRRFDAFCASIQAIR